MPIAGGLRCEDALDGASPWIVDARIRRIHDDPDAAIRVIVGSTGVGILCWWRLLRLP